jgi:HSP20 family protein
MKSLIPWSRSTGLLQPLRQEMDELFQRFFSLAPGNGSAALETWAPSVDVEESEKEIVVKADLPGVDPKDIDISIVDGSLVLKGEKKQEKEEKKKNYHRVERFYGQFFREIPLPAGADADKVVASSTKGVISVTIPKKPEAQPKKIAVKAQD